MKQQKTWGLVILALTVFAALIVANRPIKLGSFTLLGHHPAKYGLDIRGGARVTYRAMTERAPNVAYDQATIQKILETRLTSLGISEFVIQPRPQEKQFIVEIPDVKNIDAVLQQIGTTAQMTFYYFPDVQSSGNQKAPLALNKGNEFTVLQPWHGFNQLETFRDGKQIKTDWAALLDAAKNNVAGPSVALYASPAANPAQQQLLGAEYDALTSSTPIYFNAAQTKTAAALNKELIGWNTVLYDGLAANSGQPVLTGAELLPNSRAELDQTSQPAVSQSFNASGTAKFGQFTSAHIGEIMGIVLDDSLLSSPVIRTAITDGNGQISGNFATLAEAQSLANLLNAGALPIPLEQVRVESQGASLGQNAVHQSIIAGLVGIALVLLFMLVYYRLPGLLADIALLIYVLFSLAVFRGAFQWLDPQLQVTLTLPGIAGFILSIGMAVDANILIFERLKEELRLGKALRPAIDAAFKRAFPAIRDSNICTSITCIVLLSLGTASVRGFALTLLLGVLISLFSAITVTRTLLYLLVEWFPNLAKNPALFGLNVNSLVGRTMGDSTHAGLNIIGRRNWFYGLSLAIIVPGLIFLAMGGLKPGIEFKSGTQVQTRYAKPVDVDAVQKALTGQGFRNSTVQLANGSESAIVSVTDKSNAPSKATNPVYARLMAALNTLGPNQEQAFGNVDPVVSREVTSNAAQAVVIASLLIVLYLAAVFGVGGFVAGLRLGASAILALLHDVALLIGAFAIFGYFLGWEVDSLFITALLTVIGFSVHDTVVIFDRVRENLRHKARGEDFENLVNRSIGQTLARSINTSLTVVMTLLALVILGGQTTRLLNVALLIGIISGTYSSIFNAAAILVDWENWLAKRRANAPAPVAVAEGGAQVYTSNGNAGNGGGSSRPTATLPPPGTAPARPPAPGEIQISAIKAKKKKPSEKV